MKKYVRKRVLPMLMALAIVVGLLPVLGGTVEAATTDEPARIEELTATTTKTLEDGVTYYITGNLKINSSRSYKNGLVVANNATVTICIPAGMTLTVYGSNGSGTTGGGAAILLPEGATLTVVGGGILVAEGGKAGDGAQGGPGGASYVSDDTKGKLDYEIYQAGSGGNGGNGGGGAGAGIGTNGGAGGSGNGAGGAGWGGRNADIRGKTRDGNKGGYGNSGSDASAAGTFICADTIDVSGVKGGDAGSKGDGGAAGADGFDGDEGEARGIAGGAGGGGGGGGHEGAAVGTGGGGGGQGGGGGSAGYIWSGSYVGGGGGGGGHGANGGGGGKRGNSDTIPEADCKNNYANNYGFDSSDGNRYGDQGRSGGGAYMEIGDDREVGNGGDGGSGGGAGSAAISNADVGKYQTISGEELNNWDVTLDWTGDDAGSNSEFGFDEGPKTISFELNALNWNAASGGTQSENSFYYVLCDENGNPVLDSEGNEVRGELTFDDAGIPGLSGSQASVTLPEGLSAGNYTLKIGATIPGEGEDGEGGGSEGSGGEGSGGEGSGNEGSGSEGSGGEGSGNEGSGSEGSGGEGSGGEGSGGEGSQVENILIGSFDVKIEPKPLDQNDVAVSFDDAEIALNPPVFTGDSIKPEVNLAYDGKELVEGVDYDLVYSDGTNADAAINAGDSTVTVVFKGNYSGSITKTFPIEPMTLDEENITSTLIPVMDGDVLTFIGDIMWGDTVLEEGKDYDVVVVPDAEEPSKADISIVFKGNYQNIKAEDLSIPVVYDDQPIRTLLKNNMFDFVVSDIVYTGGKINPVVTATNEEMVEGTHYTVTYENNVNVGTGKIIINGIPEKGFAGTIEKEFAIAKAEQAAPETLKVVNESVQDKNDGSISGLTDKMEYSDDGGNTWKTVSGTKLTGLEPGVYKFRYKADANHNTGEETTVTIAESETTLTVKFNLNGGTGEAIADQTGFAYGANGTVEPAKPTRDGYAFLGWTLKDGTAWIFGVQGSAVTDNITLYAKWVKTGFDVSGVIKDTSGNPVSGATITAKQGNLVYDIKTTSSDGTYRFENVPAGTYNLVVTDEASGKTVTSLVVVAANGKVADIALPEEKVSSEIKVAPGTPNVMVGGLEEQADAVMQQIKDDNAGASIEYVTVDMSIEAKVSDQLDEVVKEKIEETAASQSENLAFVDIDIKQIAKINDSEQEKPITETADLLKIIIPFDTTGKRDFKIFRYHANHKSGEDVQPLTTTKNDDNEYIEVGSGQITIYARFFSTYAIGYSEDGSAGGTYVPSYSVTGPVTKNGEVTLSSEYPASGSTVTVNVTPDEGYELERLIITDSTGKVIEVTDNGNGTFSFKMPYGNVTVNATFRQIELVCPKDETCPVHDYTDAFANAWYHNGVHYCIENGLMSGMGDNLFAPNGATTRAQIVNVLWRLEGKPVVNYAMSYTDVAEGKWYTEAVRWAASEDIMIGYGDQFAPNEAITREQMVSVLWRYCKYKGVDVSIGEETNILSYDDAFDISNWAIPAMQWACGADVINGIADGDSMKLDPTGTATRAQVATMLQRFCVEILGA